MGMYTIIQLDTYDFLYLFFNLVKHGMNVYDVLPIVCQGSRLVSHLYPCRLKKKEEDNTKIVPTKSFSCTKWNQVCTVDQY